MAFIYEQHKAAFSRVSAFVILDAKGERVATVAIKFPADGSGRLYAYVHVIGVEMVRAFANGYGYDKRSAAVADAILKIGKCERDFDDGSYSDRVNDTREKFRLAAPLMDSDDWIRSIESMGFKVLQAV